jgi:ribose 1,5-bisphosphokinase
MTDAGGAPRRLVWVMGPSGAGKDSVLAWARARLDGTARVLFAHRYATRPPDPRHPGEVALGAGEFALRRAEGLFAFAWEAWGVGYAVGTEVRAWTARGLAVAVSGSREHFVAAAHRDADVLPVLVTASPAVRAQRLRARAREPEAEIVARLARGDALAPAHPALVTIVNDGALEDAGARLVGLLRGVAAA